jgi:hypothetical protein
MRTFIQLKNNIGFSTIKTIDEPNHLVTPDDTTCVEVFTDDAEQFLKKTYNSETKSWSDSPVLQFAEVNSNGDIIEIRKTVFEHEVNENYILMPDNITHKDKYIDGQWVVSSEVN